MNPEYKDILDLYELALGERLEYLKSELLTVRAGRANPKILDKIKVNYYETLTPLNQVANISAPDPRLIVISPWDVSLVKEIVKQIMASDLGLNPADDGKLIRLSLPPLTEERRRELVKQVKKMGEDCKVNMRSERRDVLENFKKIKKENNMSEDMFESIEKEVQKLLDNETGKIDAMVTQKEKEILEV